MKTVIFFSSLFFSLTLLANAQEISPKDLELNANGNFVECELENGLQLFANAQMVIVGDKVLSRKVTRALLGKSAEHLQYESSDSSINVSKQFCARGGIQTISITNKKTKSKKILTCKTQNECE